MEAVPADTFFEWTKGVGVDFDQRYPDSGCLCLVPPREHNRFWTLPGDPATWPHFIASLLGGLDEWETGYLWPRSGSWPEPSSDASCNEGVRDVVLRGAGVPGGSTGAVRFTHTEENELIAVLYAYLAFGWCSDDDLYFVPDHGRQLLQTDHHDVVHIDCGSEERILRMVEDVAKAGYKLPTDLPDWTFKRPAWMGSADIESSG